MKLIHKEQPSQMFTLLELSKKYNITTNALANRCKRLKIYPVCYNKKYQYWLNYNEANKVTETYAELSRKENELNKFEVIYCHTIWEIRESKLNFN